MHVKIRARIDYVVDVRCPFAALRACSYFVVIVIIVFSRRETIAYKHLWVDVTRGCLLSRLFDKPSAHRTRVSATTLKTCAYDVRFHAFRRQRRHTCAHVPKKNDARNVLQRARARERVSERNFDISPAAAPFVVAPRQKRFVFHRTRYYQLRSLIAATPNDNVVKALGRRENERCCRKTLSRVVEASQKTKIRYDDIRPMIIALRSVMAEQFAFS